MQFPCRLCGYNVTITKNDRGGWGLSVLHENEFGPVSYTHLRARYSFLDWEVRILGGFDEAAHRIFVEEQRDPQCQYVAGQRILASEFVAFENHRAPWSRETVEHLLEKGWPEESPPTEHELRLEGNEIRCVCGDVWPLLEKITASTTTEDAPLEE